MLTRRTTSLPRSWAGIWAWLARRMSSLPRPQPTLRLQRRQNSHWLEVRAYTHTHTHNKINLKLHFPLAPSKDYDYGQSSCTFVNCTSLCYIIETNLNLILCVCVCTHLQKMPWCPVKAQWSTQTKQRQITQVHTSSCSHPYFYTSIELTDIFSSMCTWHLKMTWALGTCWIFSKPVC